MEYRSGGNSNVRIDREKGVAVKTLKTSNNVERNARYLREINILKSLQERNLEGIVEIIAFDDDKQEIIMKAYDGDLELIYEKTKGNVKRTIQLILPLVRTLKLLSELDIPIYHRDIKPQNILVENVESEECLVLADFGCAYWKEEDKRVTDTFRAVGAQAYRAPEYQYGKVQDVDEKGDIFSLGKILWNMVNGIKNEVFPYTLWFPSEYNLCNRFQNTTELLRLNNLIAACVNYSKENRPDYPQIIEELESILDDKESSDNPALILKAKEFEAKRILEDIENKELAITFLTTYFQDFSQALQEMSVMELEILKGLENWFEKVACIPNVEKHIIDLKMDCRLVDFSFQEVYFHNSFRACTNSTDLLGLPGVKRGLPCICSFYGGGAVKRGSMAIFIKNGLLYYKDENGRIAKYTHEVWKKYLEEFISRYIN